MDKTEPKTERSAEQLATAPASPESIAEGSVTEASAVPATTATTEPTCEPLAVPDSTVPPAHIAATKASSPGHFTPEHEQYLVERGVDLALAERAGLRSVDGAEAASLLGRSRAFACGGLAIPYPGTTPPYVRVRLDDPKAAGDMRYVVPAGRPVPLYLPEELPAIEPLVVVESPIKALALVSAGIAAVGLGGTGTTLVTKAGARQLHESWGLVPPIGKEVVILFDSNRQTNVNVARDEARLALALERGEGKVKAAALPRAAGGADWGPDDFLAALGPASLYKVIEEAPPANPVEHARAHLARCASLDKGAAQEHAARLLADLAFLVAILERGAAARSAIEPVLREHKVPIRGLDQALKEAAHHIEEQTRRSAEERKSDKPPGSIGDQYEIIDGCLCEVSTGRDGEPIVHPLCNFTANIVREVVRDDGSERSREFWLRGRLADGTPLHEIVLEAEEFGEPAWVLRSWGSRALIRADSATPHKLRGAIQKFSCPSVLDVYAHTGWRQLGEDLVFLHGGGAVGGNGITVELPDQLGRYRLPNSIEDLAEAVRLSLRCLELAPPEVTFPLLAAVYRAPTMSMLYANATLWIHGRSGAFKSSLAALFLCHFGAFDHANLPATWSDTAATLEYRLHVLKDLLFLIDDFVPRGADSWDEQHRKAGAILHAIGSHAARGRMRQDVTARPGRPPRALAMVTAEDMPRGSSTNARLLPVHLVEGMVRAPLLSELQAKAGRLPHAMAGYLLWLRERYADLAGKIEARQIYWRDRFAAAVHKRLPNAQAHLMVGLELFAAFARDLGVLGRESARELLERGQEALLLVGREHAQAAREADTARRFLDVIATLVAQGKVTLAVPSDPLEQRAGCEAVGWRDDGERVAYLLPEAAFRVVVSAMSAAGEAMPVQMQTLWERLAQSGALAARDRGHYTVKRVLGRERHRVLAIRLQALEPEDDPEPPTGGDPAKGAPEPLAVEPSPAAGPAAPTSETSGSPAIDYRCVRTLADFGHLLARLRRAQVVAVDTETRPRRQDLPADGKSRKYHALAASMNEAIGISFSFALADRPAGGEHSYLPLRHATGEPQLALEDVHAELAAFFGDPKIRKVFHNAKFDLNVLRSEGFELRDLPHDTLTLASLCDLYALPRLDAPDPASVKEEQYDKERPSLGLKNLGQRHVDPGAGLPERELDAFRVDLARKEGIRKQDITYDRVPVARMTEYAAGDTRLTLALEHILAPALDEPGQRLYQTERALIPILADMEYRGVLVDREVLACASADYERKAHVARDAVFAAAGRRDFNIESGRQLVRVFRELGIPLPLKDGKPSIDKHALQSLAPHHRLARALQGYRTVAKLKGTYTDSFAAKLDEHGHLHCSFKAHGTRTGRLSCEAPSLQNVPAAVRAAFVPPPGHVIVAIDFAGIELRVLAHCSADPVMVDAFLGGKDPHLHTAIEVFGASDDPEEMARRRKLGKNLNFAIGYGAGAHRIAAMSGKPIDTARQYLERFYRVYGGIRRWKEHVIAEAHRTGLVQNLYGRTRRLPVFLDPAMRRTPACFKAERVAVNTIIQGTAADLFKETLVNVARLLRDRDAKTRMVLNVHDEIMFYVPCDELALVADIQHVMEHPSIAVHFRVPLVAEVSWSQTSWRDKVKGLPTAELLEGAPAPAVPLEEDEDSQDLRDGEGTDDSERAA